jgi:uncharacterized membrane protein YqjE
MDPDRQEARSEGLGASIRNLAQSLLGVFQTRLEILSTEIAEERFNLTRAAIVVVAVIFCFQAGAIFAVLFIVLAVGTENRLAAIGIAALALLLAAGGGALWLRHWLKTRPAFFADTIAELRKDRDRLKKGA